MLADGGSVEVMLSLSLGSRGVPFWRICFVIFEVCLGLVYLTEYLEKRFFDVKLEETVVREE